MKFFLTLVFLLGWGGLLAQVQEGEASYYADKFEGLKTASGEIYRHSKLTAAHLSLPFNTLLRVTNVQNDRTVIVRVNDRGPFVRGRIIDLSRSAAEQLDFIAAGIVEIRIEVIGQKGMDRKIPVWNIRSKKAGDQLKLITPTSVCQSLSQGIPKSISSSETPKKMD